MNCREICFVIFFQGPAGLGFGVDLFDGEKLHGTGEKNQTIYPRSAEQPLDWEVVRRKETFFSVGKEKI